MVAPPSNHRMKLPGLGRLRRGKAPPAESPAGLRAGSMDLGRVELPTSRLSGLFPEDQRYLLTLIGVAIASLSAGRASLAPTRLATALNVTLPICASALVKV
jgi:hypothetical protein